MRGGLSVEDFARLTHVAVADVARYRSVGLLDPDGDGEFDEYDIIRLRFMQLAAPDLVASGQPEELAKVIEDLARHNPWGDVLYGTPGSRLSLKEAASRIGLTEDQARSIQVATGVSDTFISEDALTTMKQLLDAGIPWEAIVEGSRVLGDSIRRVADTEVRLFHTHVHERLLKEGVPNDEVVRTIRASSEALLPVMDRVIQLLHRAHILRASVEDALLHLEGDEPAAVPGTMETSILFVDIALFTTLAQTHGDHVAVEVVERFDDLVRGLALDHHGSIVKQIGDEFMMAFNDPEDAVRFAVALDEVAAQQENFPALRMAINHGPVVFRLGDYFGNTVNIASRIASMAASGEILITEAVARAAERAGVPVESAGVRIARGVTEPLTLWRVLHQTAKGQRDPVCGMMVGNGAAGRFTFEGREFWFCSAECLSKFLHEPRRYAEQATSP